VSALRAILAALTVAGIVPFLASDSASSQVPVCAVSDDGVIVADTCPGADLGARIEAAEAASTTGATIVVRAPAIWTTNVSLYGRVLEFRGGTYTYSGPNQPAIALGNSTLRGAGFGQTTLTSATVTGMVGVATLPLQHAISVKDITVASTAPTAGLPLVDTGRSYVGAVVDHVLFGLTGQAVPALHIGGQGWGPVTVQDAWITGSGVDNVLIESTVVWGGGGQAFLSRVTTERWGAGYAGIHVKGVDGGGYITSIRDTHCEKTPPTNGEACIRSNVRMKVDTVVWFGSYPNPAVTCAVVNITGPGAWNPSTYIASVEMVGPHVGCAAIRNDQTGAVVNGQTVRYEVP